MAVCTEENSSGEFCISVGLYEGLVLSLFLFVIKVNELTRELRGEEIWELLFADDLAVMNKKKRGLQKRLKMAEMPRERRAEDEYGRQRLWFVKGWRGVLRVRNVHEEEIRQVKEFKYLGTILWERGGSSRDVQERVKAGWRK